MSIVILDLELTNVGSVQNMLRKIGVESKISNQKETILNATKLILPGIGTFDNGMSILKSLGIINTLQKKILEECIPILGICLGMQMLAHSSEEGTLPGLGFIDANVVRFDSSFSQKIPHIGWNTTFIEQDHSLFSGFSKESRFYFAHSYHVKLNDRADLLTTTFYGENFVSSFAHKNILAVQFHPEKSHKFGELLLKNFIEKI